MEACSRTDDWRYAHIGDLVFQFFMVACHLSPQEHLRLWHDGVDQAKGFQVGRGDAELCGKLTLSSGGLERS